jgi:predicted ATPase
LFIGSSTEQKAIVDALAAGLRREVEPVPWYRGVFGLSRGYLESLMTKLNDVDFAAFLFAADDELKTRKAKTRTVRDNVLFEYGLFLGRIGRERCFVIRPRGDEMHTPSDLLGICCIEYDPDRMVHNRTQACAEICDRIRTEVKRVLKERANSMPEAILGHWIQIKRGPRHDRPLALISFGLEKGRIQVSGTSYTLYGKAGVRFPSGPINLPSCSGDEIVLAYSAEWKDPGGEFNRSFGLSRFCFSPHGGYSGGNGYYAAYSEGGTLKPQHVEFDLRRLTPEFLHFLIGRYEMSQPQEGSQVIRAFSKLVLNKRVVITGGPCSGKTELIKRLAHRGLPVLKEAAELEIAKGIKRFRSRERFNKWRGEHPLEFQTAVFNAHRTLENGDLTVDRMLFMDRSGVDCLAFLERRGVHPPPELETYAKESRFFKVFVLDTLSPFKPRKATGRISTYEDSVAIRDRLADIYQKFGHEVIRVPIMPIPKRIAFILDRVGGGKMGPFDESGDYSQTPIQRGGDPDS